MTATTSPKPRDPDEVLGKKSVLYDGSTLTISFEFQAEELNLIFRQRFSTALDAMARTALKHMIDVELQKTLGTLVTEEIKLREPQIKTFIAQVWEEKVRQKLDQKMEETIGKSIQELKRRILGRDP